jgi:hypothetical protein
VRQSRRDITAEQVRELLHYDPETGVFTWLVPHRGHVGTAGHVKPDGYLQIGIGGHKFYAHRLAWLWVNGQWPDGDLDHRDTNRANNAIGNLRPATQTENNRNTRASRSASGLKGVSRHPRSGWRAKITVEGRSVFLGRFATPQEAHAAYCEAARKAFGEFWRPA